MNESRIALAEPASIDFTPARVLDAPAGSEQRLLLEELYRDDDTGLSNRRAWNEARPRVDADPDTDLLAVDVVGLKRTNDTLGHDAGDRLIGEVASAMRRIADEMEIPPRNLWRIGGDEFVAAVPAGRADDFGRRLREAVGSRPIRETEFVSGIRYGVGADFSAADHALLVARRLEAPPACLLPPSLSWDERRGRKQVKIPNQADPARQILRRSPHQRRGSARAPNRKRHVVGGGCPPGRGAGSNSRRAHGKDRCGSTGKTMTMNLSSSASTPETSSTATASTWSRPKQTLSCCGRSSRPTCGATWRRSL